MKKKTGIVIIMVCMTLMFTSVMVSAEPVVDPWKQYQSHGGMSLSMFLFEFQQIPENSVEYQQAAMISYFLSVHGSI